MKVGDLIREKAFPEDACAIIVEVGDLRSKEPYKVYCPAYGGKSWLLERNTFRKSVR